jgi:hypothetical protein
MVKPHARCHFKIQYAKKSFSKRPANYDQHILIYYFISTFFFIKENRVRLMRNKTTTSFLFPVVCATLIVLAISSCQKGQARPSAINVEYPLDGTQFPPDITAPTFRWHDAEKNVDIWTISVKGNGNDLVFQSKVSGWQPQKQDWETIKGMYADKTAVVDIVGANAKKTHRVLS